MKSSVSRFISIGFIVTGVLFLILTAGFFFQMTWATALWPWQDGRLSYIFVASIMAASAVPIIWIGMSGEFGAARAGAINLGTSALGIAVYLSLLYRQGGELKILLTAIASAVFLLVNLGIYNWSRRFPLQDRRSVPLAVRISFGVFAVVLVLVALALLLHSPTIFPWRLKPETSTVVGFIFLGAALYFVHSVLFPSWHNARGQLLGFLAYDLILIGPFLAHFSDVSPEHRMSLIIYTIVLVYSGGLAVYYLFVNNETRSWKVQTS